METRRCPACGFLGHITPSCPFLDPTSKAQRSAVEYLTTDLTAQMVGARFGLSRESVLQAVRVRTDSRVSTLRQMTARLVEQMRAPHPHDWRPIANECGRYRCSCGVLGYRASTGEIRVFRVPPRIDVEVTAQPAEWRPVVVEDEERGL